MGRGRCTPGGNGGGEAGGGTYSNRIRWQIPEGSDNAVEVAGFGLDTTLDSWPRGAIPADGFTRIDPAAHYPPAAPAAREPGTVHLELAIDRAGRDAGRATRRAGVCQSVELPVVAGTVKITKQANN